MIILIKQKKIFAVIHPTVMLLINFLLVIQNVLCIDPIVIEKLEMHKTKNLHEQIYWSNDGRYLAITYKNSNMYKIWDTYKEKFITTSNLIFYITSFAWCPNSNKLAIGTNHGQLFIRDIDTNIITQYKVSDYAIDNLAWSNSGLLAYSLDTIENQESKLPQTSIFIIEPINRDIIPIGILAHKIDNLKWSPCSQYLEYGYKKLYKTKIRDKIRIVTRVSGIARFRFNVLNKTVDKSSIIFKDKIPLAAHGKRFWITTDSFLASANQNDISLHIKQLRHNEHNKEFNTQIYNLHLTDLKSHAIPCVTFSPNNDLIAFATQYQINSITIGNTKKDASEAQLKLPIISQEELDNSSYSWRAQALAWSPDKKTIAAVINCNQKKQRLSRVILIDVAPIFASYKKRCSQYIGLNLKELDFYKKAWSNNNKLLQDLKKLKIDNGL